MKYFLLILVMCHAPLKALANDPLDEIEVVDYGSDPSGKEFVKQHRALETEIRAGRKALLPPRLIDLKTSAASSLAEWGRDAQSPTPRAATEAEANPQERAAGAVSRLEDVDGTGFWDGGAGPPKLREFILREGQAFRDRRKLQLYPLAAFSVRRTRNSSGTVKNSSSTTMLGEDSENEATRIRTEVFRTRNQQNRVHPGSKMRRP